MGSKRLKLEEEKEDRISDLPDSIIHYILSFLPSTKQAVQTCVLSKRWRTQWTQVPDLIFINSTGTSYENFLKFIDNTLDLHDCSKIKKFHLKYGYYDHDKKDPQFASKICFATRKHVEDLNFSSIASDYYMLPEILFNNASLVKLRTKNCSFMPNGKVNWGCLTTLNIVRCKLTDQAIDHILSGSPLLKSLELTRSLSEKVVIASKSLKILVLGQLCGFGGMADISDLEISCPNLEQLSMDNVVTYDPELFVQAIENIVSHSLLLQSFDLNFCRGIERMVIASKSLKRLVLSGFSNDFDIKISCPQLEELKLSGFFNVKTAKLLNLPSSLCADIDFYHHRELKTCCKRMVEDILHQLQHVKELKIGRWLTEVLSAMKVRDRFSPVLNIKCLTLLSPYLEKHHHGIAYVLRISPLLEKLVIIVPLIHTANHKIGNNYWISNATVFDCLVSHLKTIEIIGFAGRYDEREHMLNLVQFLLNNARVLEKMVVVLNRYGTTFDPLEVSQEELLSLPRCSQNAIIEVLSPRK